MHQVGITHYLSVFRGTAQHLSPDLCALDYLWGHLKTIVYSAAIEREDTLHQYILVSQSNRLQLPGDHRKGATGRVRTCPCVR